MYNKKLNPIRESVSQFCVLASFVVALFYGAQWFPQEGWWPVITKGATVSLLALFVLIRTQTVNHFLLLLALIASVAGDVLLAMPIDNSFIKGLSAFLSAHLIFIGLYLKNKQAWEDISRIRKQIILILWIIALVSTALLYPYLGDMLIPVIAYTFVLTAMASAAFMSRFSAALVGFGAVLFLVSDAVLGARQFLSIPDYFGYVVWGTYYFAQLFMTLGIMLADERRTHYGGYRFD